MSEAVTYADLQFVNLPLKECQKAVFKGDEEEDPGVTYENVETLNAPVRREDNSVPGNRGQAQAPGGLQSRPCSLLLLLLCLGSLSATVGIIIKYLQVSRELGEISASHTELNSSLSGEIRSREEALTLTHQRLTTLQTDLHRLMQDLSNLNRSLQLCNVTERKTRENLIQISQSRDSTLKEKEALQKTLTETQEQLRHVDTEYCPSKWTHFGMRCLFFSEEKETWEESKLYCEKKKSTLLILRYNDDELKEFIWRKQEDYWVGNGIEWRDKSWKTSNAFPECYYYCAKISKWDQQYDYKTSDHKWICEKKLVLLDTEKHRSDYYYYLFVQNQKFKCENYWHHK